MSSIVLRKGESSWAMRLFNRLGFSRIAWSLRRLYCPVSKDSLVLEVGSGGSPYHRSNVLLDAYFETRERHWQPLVSDRPTVLGFVEKLPFPDKSFDFVIASHVLEHSTDPEAFLKELQRVARAGYIEVPDAFMERINPYRDHRLEISLREDELKIWKKGRSIVDPELVELYEQHAKSVITRSTMRKNPFQFHVRYYWNETIPYKIVNPETSCDWQENEDSESSEFRLGVIPFIKSILLNLARNIFSQTSRNKGIDITNLLICPECRTSDLLFGADDVVCSSCDARYELFGSIPVMIKRD